MTGEAIYTDDLVFDGMLFASGHARRAACLRPLDDIQKAQALPGVVAVLTAEDIPGEH